MKQILLSAFLLATLGLSAQLVEVESVRRIEMPAGVFAELTAVSPDGTFALIGEMGGHAIKKVNLADGTVSTVTDHGNPNGAFVASDNRTAVFRRATLADDHRRYQSLVALDTESGTETEIIPASRRMCAGAVASGDIVAGVNENGLISKSLKDEAADVTALPAFAMVNLGHLDIADNGKVKTIDPNGTGSYLWPSVSPDGTRVAYFLVGGGAYVCNIDGSEPVALGFLHAPAWLGNDKIVGMTDISQAQRVQSSQIVVVAMDGTRQTISPSDARALYPSVSRDAKTVVYSDFNGELYVLTLK